MPFLIRHRLVCVALGLLLIVQRSPAQNAFHIYLVGDAGDHREAGKTLVSLQKELLGHPNSAVVYLGDNSYKDALWGLLPFGFKGFDSTRNTMDKVRSQLAILDQYKGYAYFIPGNHDWWNETTYTKGRKKLAMEQSFIEENLKQNKNIANPGKTFLPANGDYGPEYVELDSHRIRLVFIDTYRIIQTGIRKSVIPEEEKTFYLRLDSVIRAGYLLSQQVIVVAHHPVYSAGPYNRPLKHPYFSRRIKASMSTFPSYHNMVQRMNEVLRHYPGIFYVSGHIHALQYFYTKDSIHYIISGAGSKENMLSAKEISKYDEVISANQFLLWNSGGFFELSFSTQASATILHYNEGLLKCTIP